MRVQELFESPSVRVATVTTDRPCTDCEDCGAECAGCWGIYWDAQEEPCGLVYVCSTEQCLRTALRTALNDAPDDTMVLCEYEIPPARTPQE